MNGSFSKKSTVKNTLKNVVKRHVSPPLNQRPLNEYYVPSLPSKGTESFSFQEILHTLENEILHTLEKESTEVIIDGPIFSSDPSFYPNFSF